LTLRIYCSCCANLFLYKKQYVRTGG